MKRILFATILAAAIIAHSAPAPAATEIKYALSVLHYNLQYVAGDTKIENKIIQYGLDPLLDFYLAHPNWGADIEMQGYMIEETAKRFPQTYEKLKTLINRGQLDLVSFHYSDQLFLAYPQLDAAWSVKTNDAVFEKYGVKRSGTVFTQEGQFGEGQAAFMADHGYDTLVLPKNLYRYQHGELDNPAPYYALNGVNVVIGAKGVEYHGEATVKTAWTYMDDAELLPTGRATPYSEYYKYKPEKMQEYGDELKSLEDQGYKIGKISDYINDLKKAGVKPAKLDPMVDGSWQPKDTDNIFRWMGDYRAQFERDNEILTENYRVRGKLAAAQTIIDHIRGLDREKDAVALEQQLEEAWRLQCLAEVSDSTGWTPMPVEIEYSQSNSAAVEKITDAIAARAKEILGTKYLSVDVASGKITLADAPAKPAEYPETKCPVEYKLTGEIEKEMHTCYKVDASTVKMVAKFKSTNWYKNNTRMIFPRETDNIIYSPALHEETYVKYPASAFKSETGSFYLPLSNGMIGLADNMFMIEKLDTVHVSPRFGFDEKTVSIDMRKPPSGIHTWVLYFYTGTPEDAVKLANKLNVFPTVEF